MKLVEIPLALPGSCKACGSASKSPYVDTEMHEDYHGRVYYCHECAGIIAQLLGFISPEQANALITENVDLAQLVFNLKIENENLRKAVDGLVRSGYNSNVSDATPIVDSISNSPSLFDELESTPGRSNDVESSGGTEELGNREGETPESSNDEGVGDLRSNDESNEFSLQFPI